jgi:hypothetical protein
MKEFYSFNLTIDPQNCDALSQNMSHKTKDEVTGEPAEHLDQIEGVMNTSNQIQQAEIFRDDEIRASIITQSERVNKDTTSLRNIYGKAENFSSNEEKVANEYKKQSNTDAPRFGDVELNIDGKTFKEKKLPETVAKKYGIELGEVSMTHITSYLQEKYEVSISNAQKNFLNTQWDQASVRGASATFSLTGFPQNDECIVGNDRNKPSHNVFNFNKDRQLENVQYTYNVINIHTMEMPEKDKQTGTFSTTADISNLQQTALPANNPWIP